MELGISRHLMMFLFILSFFSGVSCLTLVTLTMKRGKEIIGDSYTMLGNFCGAIFLFVFINFCMFYRHYFFLHIDMSLVVNFAYDLSLVSLLYFWIKFNVLEQLDKWLPVIKIVSGIYLCMWLIVYAMSTGFMETNTIVASCFALTADACYCVFMIGCLAYSIWDHKRNNQELREKRFFIFIDFTFIVYLMYLYAADLYSSLGKMNFIPDAIADPFFWDPVIPLSLIVNIFTILYIFQKMREAHIFNLECTRDWTTEELTDYIEGIYTQYHISEREKEIIQLVVKGMSNPQISEELSISNYTAKRHMNNIFKKTGVKSRFELIGLVKGK